MPNMRETFRLLGCIHLGSHDDSGRIRTTRNLDSHLAGMNSCDWVLKNEPADVCRPQGNQSGLNDIFDKELLHACCTLRCKWDLSAQLRSC
jgi:hypothetical protein